LKRVAFILSGKLIFSSLEKISNKERININPVLKIIVMLSCYLQCHKIVIFAPVSNKEMIDVRIF